MTDDTGRTLSPDYTEAVTSIGRGYSNDTPPDAVKFSHAEPIPIVVVRSPARHATCIAVYNRENSRADDTELADTIPASTTTGAAPPSIRPHA